MYYVLTILTSLMIKYAGCYLIFILLTRLHPSTTKKNKHRNTDGMDVEASTNKLDAVKCEHKLVINDTCKSTRTKTDTFQSRVPRDKNSDVMRYKAGSYLMAARGLLKRVSKIDSSLLLTNLK